MNRHMINLWRVILTGFQNFFRNASLSIAAIAVMVITLTIILFSVIANATFANSIQQIRERIDISVYLKDSVSQEQRETLISQIEAVDNVRSVRFISKDQALATYKQINQSDIDLQLAISQTDNPLPASLQIKVDDLDRIDPIIELINKPENKDLQSAPISYFGDRKVAIDNITRATTFLRQAGAIGVVVFAVVSMLIIFNTIQMAIFNRRDELNIMRLLGATKAYIRGPFLVETIIYGIFSGIISVVLCNSVFVVSSNVLGTTTLGLLDIGFANEYFADRFWRILAVQIAIGIAIGVVSSAIATQRYLRFKSGN